MSPLWLGFVTPAIHTLEKKKWLKKIATQHLFYKISGFLFALNKHKKDDHFVIRQNVEIKAVLML